MRGFKAGSFEREAMPRGLRAFSPTEALASLEEVDLAELKGAGKRLILLDVDNTMVPWRADEAPASTLAWLKQGKDLGLQFCILSNTRNPARLERLSAEWDVPYIRDKFKPSRKMYRLALERYSAQPEEAVMIGDQLLTDVLGANRADIDAIWVRPIASREFIGTRLISRRIEWLVGRFLYRYFQPELLDDGTQGRGGFFDHHIVRQFAKFCLVGGTSTVIDVGLHWSLMFIVHMHNRPLGDVFGAWLIANFPLLFGGAAKASDAAVPVLKVFTASIAILNSFYWNRLWTFRIKDKADRMQQLQKFIAVAVIGMVLNTTITTLLNNVIPGHPKRSLAIATIIATIVVAFWNFTGQRLWTFRKASA